jgi:hypothetical protein
MSNNPQAFVVTSIRPKPTPTHYHCQACHFDVRRVLHGVDHSWRCLPRPDIRNHTNCPNKGCKAARGEDHLGEYPYPVSKGVRHRRNIQNRLAARRPLFPIRPVPDSLLDKPAYRYSLYSLASACSAVFLFYLYKSYFRK